MSNLEIPFGSASVQSLFHLLCRKWLGDSFDVCFLPRFLWEKKKPDVLENRTGKLIMYIPEDATVAEIEELTALVGAEEAKVRFLSKQEIPVARYALVNFLFRRGMKYLAENLPFASLPVYIKNSMLHWKQGQNTLYEALRLDVRKAELETVRKTGDIFLIADKEREIADKIQTALCYFPGDPSHQCPSDLILYQNGNCRGRSMIGGSLLLRLGITSILGDVPKHSTLVGLFEDNVLEWRDMTNPQFNEVISLENISRAEISDVLAFAKHPKPEGFMFDFVGKKFSRAFYSGKNCRPFLTLFPLVEGLQMQLLHGVAYELVGTAYGSNDATLKESLFLQALEACKLSAYFEPQYEYAFNKMGEVLLALDRYEEAAVAFEKSRVVNPRNAFCYYGLGKAYLGLDLPKEALPAYQQYLLMEEENDDTRYFIEKAKMHSEEILKKIFLL